MPYKYKLLPVLSSKHIDRFWGRVALTANSKCCWEWEGTIIDNKYGCMSIGKYAYLSHRLSYFLNTGNDPKNMLVCHTCDNPKCVNPTHLFLGTHQDNLIDMVKKGRGLSGEFLINYMKENPKIQNGEDNSQAKLTSEQVLEIREIINSYKGRGKYKKLGSKYNVSSEAISLIVRRKRWAHI